MTVYVKWVVRFNVNKMLLTVRCYRKGKKPPPEPTKKNPNPNFYGPVSRILKVC